MRWRLYAALSGHLTVLQWLHANNAPWNEWTCAHAAERGHLVVLQWLHANGAPWDRRVCTYASDNEHVAVLKWNRDAMRPRVSTARQCTRVLLCNKS